MAWWSTSNPNGTVDARRGHRSGLDVGHVHVQHATPAADRRARNSAHQLDLSLYVEVQPSNDQQAVLVEETSKLLDGRLGERVGYVESLQPGPLHGRG